MPTPDAEGVITVAIRTRKTHELIGQLSDWVGVSWSENWRGFGTGKLVAFSESFTRDELNQLVGGDGEIEATRTWVDGDGIEHVDQIIGPVTAVTYRDGDLIIYRRDLASVTNEVIVAGDDVGAARNITRRFDAGSQTAFGLREIVLDQPDFTVTAEREDFGDAYMAQRLTGQLAIQGGGRPSAKGIIVEVQFRDLLGYLADRYVDTDTVAIIDPTSGTPAEASTIIESFLDSELVNPTISRRDADYNLVVTVASPAVGALVQYPVRWRRLSDVVDTLCSMGGDLGITYALDDTTDPATVRYEVKAKNPRPGVIISEAMTDQQYDIRPGDEVTAEAFLLSTSVTPDLAPQTVLCLGRRLTFRPGSAAVVLPEIGLRQRDIASILMGMDSRNAGSQMR